jgi:hypothetical protein
MARQTEIGKAFEYACLNAIFLSLKSQQEVVVEKSKALQGAEDFYRTLDEKTRTKLDKGANAAIKTLMRLEPQLSYHSGNEPLFLVIQEDKRGQKGDVRDILTIRKQNEWEVGISCKHNHTAVKHSRLSAVLDFGNEWFGIPCSNQYFSSIQSLFQELKVMRQKGALWKEVENKSTRFYVPLLNAFIKEVKRLDSKNQGIIPKRLMEYLLGRNDFYKIITNDKKKVTRVQAFNIHNTLNRPSGNEKPQLKLPQIIMPDKIFDISYKPNSDNTIIVTCNNGWAVSLRIHSASTKVEASLKFDVKLIGIPPSLYSHDEPWG